MSAKSIILLFVLWSHWHTAAFGLDVEALNRMQPSQRLAWVSHFVETDLLQMDSVKAFQDTDLLFELARQWGAPDIETELYTGLGRYRLEVLKNPEGALSVFTRGQDFARQHDLQADIASMQVEMANAYRQARQPVSAYEYYLQAHDAFSRIGFDRVDRIDRYEYEIGRFLYELEDYPAALQHLTIADRYSDDSHAVRYEIVMLTADIYRQLNTDKSRALAYFQRSLQLGQKENNLQRMGLASIRVGERHLEEGRYADARIYLATGQKWSLVSHQPELAAQALVLLAKVNVQEGNLHAAAQKLTEAEDSIRHVSTGYLLPEIYHGWMFIFEKSNNFREAYRYRKMYDRLQDSLQNAALLRASANIQLRLEARLKLAQAVQVRHQADQDRMLGLIALGLVLFVALVVYLLLRWVFRRQQTQLILAKQNAERALEKVLQDGGQRLPVGYEPSTENPASQARGTAVPLFVEKPLYNTKEALDQILHLRLLTEDDSRNFRQIFEKIHPGFFAEIRTDYPDLTQSETRLLALTKLNLSTKEMSEILNVEPNSIRRLRNRIRQKLGLPPGDNFEKILSHG